MLNYTPGTGPGPLLTRTRPAPQLKHYSLVSFLVSLHYLHLQYKLIVTTDSVVYKDVAARRSQRMLLFSSLFVNLDR